MRKAMTEVLVKILPDGEELVRVVDEDAHAHLVDPRERVIETRSRLEPLLPRSTVNVPPCTEGLTPFDRTRAASVADEGGRSAASVETQRRSRSSLPIREVAEW
jgi:hypothetical protein